MIPGGQSGGFHLNKINVVSKLSTLTERRNLLPDQDALVELSLKGELLGRRHRSLTVIHILSILILLLMKKGSSYFLHFVLAALATDS